MKWFGNLKMLSRVVWMLSRTRGLLLRESRSHLKPYLDRAIAHNDGDLTRGVLFKLKDYPAEALFAARLLADLHRYQLTHFDTKTISMAGAILALGDVFCDDTTVKVERVADMLQSPEKVKPRNTLENLFIAIYKDLMSMLEHDMRAEFYRALINGFRAETESRRLVNGTLPKTEVMQIIQNKGGCSLLIYRALLKIPLSDSEKHALWETGAFTQIVDDIFDMKWDADHHIQTSATVSSGFGELQGNLVACCNRIKEAFRHTELPARNCREFLFVFHLFRLGTESYLRQLEKFCGVGSALTAIHSLAEQQVKFRHFTFANLVYVLPRIAVLS